MSHGMDDNRGTAGAGREGPPTSSTARIALAWAVVGIPLAYGVSQTLLRAADLFTG